MVRQTAGKNDVALLTRVESSQGEEISSASLNPGVWEFAKSAGSRNGVIIRESAPAPSELEYLIMRQVQLAIIVLKWSAFGSA